MAKIAFIGLGRMGHGMAGRYLDNGFTVAVWNRSRSKADDLVARGAAAAAKLGAFAIECSTVSNRHALDLARELRSRGLVYIDSPVTGLPDAAASGKLTLLVGAEPADLAAAQRYLVPLSTTIRHFGKVGTGTVYKLINNLMGAIQIAGVAEGLAIAEQAGLDMNLVLEALETGVAASPQVIRHSRSMVTRNFAGASFTAALRHKDAAYAVALAESLLADAPVMGRAAVQAYDKAKKPAPPALAQR